MRHFMDLNYCCLHPKVFDDLYRVYFIKMKSADALMPRELGLQCYNIYEVRLCEDCIVGDVIVFDMANFSPNELAKISPALLSKAIKAYQVFSMRVKQVYVINSPPFVGKLLQIVKMVVKPKIFARIRVCQDDSVLREIFGPEELPQDYGGRGPSLDNLNGMIQAKLDEYHDRYDLLDTMKVDESKRPERPTDDDILGFYGNFKQLNVD